MTQVSLATSAAQYKDKYRYHDIFIVWYDIMNTTILLSLPYMQELI